MRAVASSATTGEIRTGTAGWSIPSTCELLSRGQGSHLERYARAFECAEINSSFYKSHRHSTYASWAAQTPSGFRFSVKLPQVITHTQRLRRARQPLEQFLEEVAGLGTKLSVLLVQLPPSLAFDPRVVGNFFELLRALHAGPIACEPRHASWFTPSAERSMAAWHICRAAADPARFPPAGQCGGWCRADSGASDAVWYHRWHGSPRMYWSSYAHEWIARNAAQAMALPGAAARWFIFDNTAAGSAIANALEFQTHIRGRQKL